MLVSFCQGKGKLNIGAHAIQSAVIIFQLSLQSRRG